MTTEIHESGCMDDNVDYSEKAENHGIVHRQHSAKDVRDRFRSRSNSDIELSTYHKFRPRSNSDIELNTYHKDDRNHDEESLSHSMDLPPSVRGLSWTSLPDDVYIPLPERCKVEYNLGDTSQNIEEGELPRRKTYPKLEELEDLSKEGFNISESFSFHDICHQTLKAKQYRYYNLKGYGTGSSGSSSGYSTGSSGSSSCYGSQSSGIFSARMVSALFQRIRAAHAEQTHHFHTNSTSQDTPKGEQLSREVILVSNMAAEARRQRTLQRQDSEDRSDENNSDRQLPVGSVDSLRSISPIHHHGNSERHLQVPSAGSGSTAYLFDFGQSLFVERKAMQTVIDKYKDLMPPEIKVKYYDVMILYSDEDREAAEEYKRHLTEDIVLDGGHRIKAVLYDDLEMAPSSGSKIMGFQLSLQRCTFMFVFLTKAFCECEWWVFSSEVCFLEAILNPQKKWCVVPVYTVQRNKADFKIPIGLRSLKRVHYYHNDQLCKRYVKRLIGDKLHVRINREFEQSKKQHTWHFEQLNKRGKLKLNSKPPIGSRKHEEEYRRSDPRPSSKPMFLSLRKRLDKYRQSKSKYVQSVQESHSASQKLDRDHRNLPVKRTDLGESFVSNEFANICHLSLDEVPLDLEQSSDSDHSVQTTDLGEHFISNEVADLFRITMDKDTLDLEQSIDSDHSVQTTDLEDIADICNVILNEDTVDLEQSSDRDHNAETPLSHYRTSTSASLRLNQFSRSTPSEMTDAFIAYDSHPRHDLMQLGPVEISSDRYNGEKMLLKGITDHFKVQFSSEFTIQIFLSKEGNIVHFINKENEGIGIMDVQPHFFLGIPVLTINQGLDSDENVRINEYLFRNHRTCSCVELEQIDNIINRHLDSLFGNHSNLQSVSSSCIKSYDKEKRIAIIPCIVLYCSLKGYIPLEEEKFPEHIEDIPTDVREGYAFATGPGDVNNPLGLGCSIGALGRGECGSLGVFTENGSSETGFISCAHVFFSYAALKRNVEENRREILIETETEIKVRQPGGSVHDHSTDTVCGRVRSGWYGNIRVTDPFTKEELDVTVDLATVQLTDRAPSRHLMQPEIDQNLRELSGLSDWPNYNFSCCQMELDDLERHVYKCGAKTHLTKGSIKMIGSTYKKGNYRDPRSPIHLKNQFEIQSCHIAETQTPSSLPGVQEPFISPGDSGSVVFIKKNVENIHPIGLATGVLLSKLCGRSVPIKCFATPFFAVEAALRKIEPGSMIRNFQKRRELDLPIQTLTENFQRMTTQQIPANTNRQVTA